MNGAYRGLPLATLETMRTAYVNAITALATAQSYTIAGRSVTRSNLSELESTLGAINTEIRRQSGSRVSVTYANMNSRM